MIFVCATLAKYIRADNHLYTDHQFAKGVYFKKKSVIKNTISTSEKQACVLFLKTENNGHSGCDSDDSTTSLFSTKKRNTQTIVSWKHGN